MIGSNQRLWNWYLLLLRSKHAALMRKSKDGLARNQNNVSEWCDLSIRGPLLHWASTIEILLRVLSSTKRTLSSSHWKLTCSRHNIAWHIFVCSGRGLTFLSLSTIFRLYFGILVFFIVLLQYQIQQTGFRMFKIVRMIKSPRRQKWTNI
jgi:hypothetical protein